MQMLYNNDDSKGYIFVALGGLNFFFIFLVIEGPTCYNIDTILL